MRSLYANTRARLLRLSEVTGFDVYKLIHFGGLLLLYGLALGASFYFSYDLRWDFRVPPQFQADRMAYLFPVVALKLLLLLVFGQFRSLISYFGLPDLFRIALALSFCSWVLLLLWQVTDARMAPPRGVILIDFVLCMASLCTIRLALRLLREQVIAPGSSVAQQVRVAIAGAGDSGAAFAYELMRSRTRRLRPVIFVDDNPRKRNQRIHGLSVMGSIDDLAWLIPRYRIDKVVITMPSANAKKIKEIVDLARRCNVPAEIMPSVQQLASGEVKVDRIRPVELEDLLGREPAKLDSETIDGLIRNRVVLVTGAGGSIGSELARQIASRSPDRLLILDQSEVQLFLIEQELMAAGFGGVVVPLIADILDAERIEGILERYRPELVFHAAAHKHVPMMERQPAEAVKNNSFGTALLCLLCSRHRVGRVVLISTDKAINPTNVMGASKRMAELAMQARQGARGNRTQFMAVRFGNVLGSSGSVIPTFKKQIAAGGPVTVTHKDVTRYFMTIPEAVGLVLQAATMGQGGEIFVLDMGKPVKIIDVARQLIELSGFRPDIDIEIRIVGLRPGEKLYEELQHSNEQYQPTSHPRVMRFVGEPPTVEAIEACFAELEEVIARNEPREIKAAIQRYVPEYTPFYD